MAVLSKEEYFNKVYKPSIGGDAGLLSFFPSGGRGGGQVDGSPRVPDYNQFMAGTSTYSHRHDGKVYSMQAIRPTGADLNAKYDAYVADEQAKSLAAQQERERQTRFTSLADQIRGYTTTNKLDASPIYSALSSLPQRERDVSQSQYASRLNFQVSDQQIIDDINAARLNRLRAIPEMGKAQIVGIQDRINQANQLIGELPAGDPRRVSSEVAIANLTSDLKSVNDAIAEATRQVENFKPYSPLSQEGLGAITSFREYLQLPEERASQQLRQIDPESYQTAVSLGQEYRKMATEPIGATTTPETEALRRQLEGEAMAQLQLGSQLGAEERRTYEQAARAAQTARGNIFGVAPAVEEAVTTGLTGEQRKLARYGAAMQFLGSGETTGAAAARDLALREGLRQQRLGAAAGFIAGGPSIYNLAQARTGAQQGAFQNYIAANIPNASGFAQAPSTAQPFFQIADQGIPVNLQNAFANLYGSQAQYGASTYGARVNAIANSYRSFGQEFGAIAGGVSDLMKGAGGLASAGILCWVAREVYGIDNPKWLMFREWMLTKASDNLRNFYIKHGEKIAESIKNKPKIKAIIRKWMDSKIGA